MTTDKWGSPTSATVRREWQSYSTRLYIKLIKQLSSTCMQTGIRTLELLIDT